MLKISMSLFTIAILYSSCGSSGCCEGEVPPLEGEGTQVEGKIAPAAVISSTGSECVEGGTITFDGRSSSDSDGHIAKYEWILDGQKVTDNPIANFSCEGIGAKKVCLKVIDDDNLSSSYVCQTFSVKPKEVVKVPPVARIEAPDFCTIGETIQVDGTKSSDSDGEILQYAWQFDDAKSNFDKPYFVCVKEGNQTLCLHVTDNDGLKDRNCTTIIGQQVPNKPPVAKITVSQKECLVGEYVIFDAAQSSDSDGFVAHFKWFPSDEHEDSVKKRFNCTEPGMHKVCLKVVDDKGLESAQACEIVSVQKPANHPPIAKIVGLPAECTVGKTIVADGTTSSDTDGFVVAYQWQVDNNSSFSTELKPVINCDREGDKEICLLVTDNEGAKSDKVCQNVVIKKPMVQTIPPVAKISIRMNEGDSVRSFTADCIGSYDPDKVDSDNNPQNDGKILSARFTVVKTFSNGETEIPHTGGCPKWISIPDNLTSVKITLSVADDDGESTTVSQIYDWDGTQLHLRP